MSSVIGVPRPRVDAPPKVTGATRFAADVSVPGLLHARLVLSTEAHALIERIEVEEALAVPGVVAVLTAADLPIAVHGADRAHEPLAREEVVFAGQPVAMVVAESEATAEDGVEAVAVEYRPLEPVLDLELAMRPGAPPARRPRETSEGADLEAVHATVGGGQAEMPAEELSANVAGRAFYVQGDVEDAFAACDGVVAGHFSTSWIYQAYLEPQTATAWLDGDELVVNTSTQGTFMTRDTLASLFDLPLHQVRVQAAALGGAFGGKFLLAEPLAAAAALKLRRPVRMAFTRSEDFAAANPAPAEIIELRIGGRSTGELTALEGRVIADQGMCEWGLQDITSILVLGCYRWQAYRVRGYGVRTNRVSMGAYRAPGAPPACFALESLIDELADKLGLDPLELRLANAVGENDRMPGDGPPPTGVRQCLERIREHPLWQRRAGLPPDEGVGVAIGYWPGGTDVSSAACRLDYDGSLTVVTGSVDMSGTNTAFAIIAAEVFGLPLEKVRVVEADTASAPYAGASGGSKVTFTTGVAVQRAVEEARRRLLLVASNALEIAPDDLEVVDGEVRAIGAPQAKIAVEELASKAFTDLSGPGPVEGHGFAAQPSPAPSCAAHLAYVRVDRETGDVRLLGYALAQDVGRALNPAAVQGQMRGGAAQGIGWALYEELSHDDAGQLLTGSFLDYAVPSAERLPEIETLIVEVPAPDGPFGAKGIGEAPVLAGPAAIANAIEAAVSVRLRDLPMTPPRVWAALRPRA